MNEGMGSILIVDDDPGLRSLLREFLTHSGFQCEEASDGVSALQRLSESPSLQLVLTDYQMPGMNGLQLLHHLAEDPVLQRIPTILATAEHSMEIRLRAFQGGAKYVLFKPYDFTELRDCVYSLLPVLQVA